MPKFKEIEKISAELFEGVVIYTIAEPSAMGAPCLMEFVKENDNLLVDIIDTLQNDKNVVVEQTLYKAKRRIGYIDVIRNTFKDITIEVYVMRPSDSVWKTYVTERRLAHSFQRLKTEAEQIEFPNPIEGFDSIYEVVDDVIKLRMDEPKPEIVEPARKELLEETEKLRKEDEKIKAKSDLLKSIDLRLLLRTLREMTDITELTPTLVNSLIERIEVHNNDKSSGHCYVKVDIYFTAVGMIDIPTEKEILAMMKEIRENLQNFRFVA